MANHQQVKKPRKVWRIYRFRERFDIAETSRYCRKSALIYTRDFVGTSGGDEAITYQQQIDLLKNCTEHHLMLRGAFHALKAVAANRSMTYRGYLLDHKNAPASNGLIAMWLGIDAAETKKIIKDLAAVGLIEQVDLPIFDESCFDDGYDGPDNPPAGGNDQDRDNGPAEADSLAAGDTAVQGGDAGPQADSPAEQLANISEHSLTFAKTLKNDKTEKEKGKEKTAIDKSANEEIKKEKCNADRENAQNAEGKMQNAEMQSSSENAGTAERQGPKARTIRFPQRPEIEEQGKGNADAKATAKVQEKPSGSLQELNSNENPLPVMPTKSDAFGGQCDDFVPPRSSAYQPRVADPKNLHKSFDGLEVLYDRSCQQFALDVFHELPNLGYCDTPTGRRELGNFAAAWSEAQSAGLPPAYLSRLWARGIENAREIKRDVHRKKIKRPGAMWRYRFNQRLASYKDEIKQKAMVM